MPMSIFYPADDKVNPIPLMDWAVGDAPLSTEGRKVAAIGNFDGVHRGHQALISQTCTLAGELGAGIDPVVITFTPHPRLFFRPDQPGFFLADEQDKTAFLAATGVKEIIRLRFDDAMRRTSAEDFITSVLPSLGISDLLAGSDFAFGNDRSGDMDMIRQLGSPAGLSAHSVDLLASGDAAVSSTRIRSAVAAGDMQAAEAMLGRPYIISGTIEKGDQRGRTIGFPTANIRLGMMQQPAFGVYTVAIRLADAQGAPVIPGIANIGRRPTVEDRGVLLEAHLFDYDGDLYGQRINVMLLDFIRPEQAFDGLDALKEQIARDVDSARAFHARNKEFRTQD